MHALSHHDHLALDQLAQSVSVPAMSRWAVRLAYVILIWSLRSRTRAQLRHLDYRRLADVGLAPDRAHAECRKWFWRP